MYDFRSPGGPVHGIPVHEIPISIIRVERRLGKERGSPPLECLTGGFRITS
jgi:hypothetical protein